MHPHTSGIFRSARLCFSTGLIALLVAHPGPATAQEEPSEMVTDRPDQSESPNTVPGGFTQLEAGVLYAHDERSGVEFDGFEIPSTLVRIGLADRFELRVGWAGYIFEEVEEGGIKAKNDGVADGELGGKIGLWGPSLSSRSGKSVNSAGGLLVSVSLPIGEDNFSRDSYDPGIRLAVEHGLAEELSLSYNLGLQWLTLPDERGFDRDTGSDFIYTLTLGFGNVASKTRLGAFVEMFGAIPASASGTPRHSFDGGFTYLIRPSLQFDAFGGVGLSDAAVDWFIGSGLSVRFPR